VWTQQKKRHNRERFIVPAIALVVCAYFGQHSVTGRYGSESRERIELALVQAQDRLATLQERKAELAHKVDLVKTGSIERDTLDGFAREKLGLIGPRDVVFMP
jgi:cell division protein FtsB